MPKLSDPSNEDQAKLRKLSEAIGELMRENEVGGVVCLVSRESAEWNTIFPEWSGASIEGDRLGVKLNSGDAEHANETMHFIGAVRDVCTDYSKLFGTVFANVVKALKEQGAEIEHVPFAGVGYGPSAGMRKPGKSN